MTRDKKPNTCLWVPRYWPAMGGTELHTHELTKYLSCEYDVNVITHSISSEVAGVNLEQDVISANDASYIDDGIRINRLALNGAATPLYKYIATKHDQHRATRPIYSGLFYNNLLARSAAITRKAELIHFVYNGLTDSAVLAARNAAKWRIPFVFTPNILNTSDEPHAWNSFRFKKLYSSAYRIIALTNHESQFLQRQGVPADKISVVPYGPILRTGSSQNNFRESLKLGNENLVLFLGRINASKGYDVLLDACERIWSSNPSTHVVFMGPATQKAREHILSTGDSRIILWEDFDQTTKADALAACDVLCVPSRMESLGVVYIEAAFNAKPTVAIDLPVLREVIENKKSGLLVEDSPKCVADALIHLLDNPHLARTMGNAAQQLAISKFSWAVVRDSMSDIYRSAIESTAN